MLKLFWEDHDPTQGMRQGNDVGTQYRSAVYFTEPGQREQAEASRAAMAGALADAGYGEITTEFADLTDFYYAEAYHQQYLDKNPNGYCPTPRHRRLVSRPRLTRGTRRRSRIPSWP